MKKAFSQARGAFEEGTISDAAWNKFQSEVAELNRDLNNQHQGGAVYNKVMGFFCDNAHLLKDYAFISGESENQAILYGISNIFKCMNVTPKAGGEKFGGGGIQKEILEFRDNNGYGFAHKLFAAGHLGAIFTGAGNSKFPLDKDGLDAFLDAGTGTSKKAPHPYALIKESDAKEFAKYLSEYKGITKQQAKADIEAKRNEHNSSKKASPKKANLDRALNSASVKFDDNSFLSSRCHVICEPVYNFIKEKWNSLTELIRRIFKDGGKER